MLFMSLAVCMTMVNYRLKKTNVTLTADRNGGRIQTVMTEKEQCMYSFMRL